MDWKFNYNYTLVYFPTNIVKQFDLLYHCDTNVFYNSNNHCMPTYGIEITLMVLNGVAMIKEDYFVNKLSSSRLIHQQISLLLVIQYPNINGNDNTLLQDQMQQHGHKFKRSRRSISSITNNHYHYQSYQHWYYQ